MTKQLLDLHNWQSYHRAMAEQAHLLSLTTSLSLSY